MQRGMFLPKGSPPEAIKALRQAFTAVASDPAFVADYRKITGEAPDLVSAATVEQIFDRIRNVSPQVKEVLKESIAKE
jgi:tripartite-type tricarboxylate transporter receptor subunit TctC